MIVPNPTKRCKCGETGRVRSESSAVADVVGDLPDECRPAVRLGILARCNRWRDWFDGCRRPKPGG
jgi:hypothetical protein